MTIPELSFHHCGVSVPDLEQAIAWYKRVLGFQLERRFYINEAKAEVAMIRRGPLRFEIFEVHGAHLLPEGRRHPLHDIRTHGNKHIAFEVHAVDELLSCLRQQNADIAKVVNEPFGKSCFVRDCAGNLIEFVERTLSKK